MQLIHELSWLWKGIGIIALASAIVLIAAFKLHKEEYKIEIACIYRNYTDWYYCYDSMRSGSDAHISNRHCRLIACAPHIKTVQTTR